MGERVIFLQVCLFPWPSPMAYLRHIGWAFVKNGCSSSDAPTVRHGSSVRSGFVIDAMPLTLNGRKSNPEAAFLVGSASGIRLTLPFRRMDRT
jgi:hypothetical protein